MSHFSLYGGVVYTLLFFVATIVRGQTTTRLPAPPSYSDGVFTSPNTYVTQILDNGINVNVSWTTTYQRVNLYFITGGDYANSKSLLIGTTDTWLLWTVDDYGNNSLPFSFRAVNAAGSPSDQALGGFYTGQFWIRDDAAATPSSTLSTTATTPSSSVIAISGSPSSAISTTTSAESTLYSASSQPSSRLPALATNTPSTSPTSTPSPSGLSTGTLAGVVIGAVAVFAILTGAILYFRRKRRSSSSSRHQGLMEIQMAQDDHSGDKKPGYMLQDPSWNSSVQKVPAGLQEGPVELPNYRSSRQHELE